MTDLDKLIEAVERGDLKNISAHNIKQAIGMHGFAFINTAMKHDSLDAAAAMHDAILPDHLWAVTPLGKVRILDKSFNDVAESGYSGSVARAWVIAALKAYRSLQ